MSNQVKDVPFVPQDSDLVVLVNKDKAPFEFTHNGVPFVVKDKLKVSRLVAVHGVKKAFVISRGESNLAILELPEGERNPNSFTVSDEKLQKKQEELEVLAQAVKDLEAEVEAKDKMIDELKKELAETKKKK